MFVSTQEMGSKRTKRQQLSDKINNEVEGATEQNAHFEQLN